MSMIEDIAVYLNSLGIGVYPGVITASSVTTTIYLDGMRDKIGDLAVPDLIIALFARPGRPWLMSSSSDIHQPELHIEVRAATYTAAKTKAEAISTALHKVHDTMINGHRYILINALCDPTKLTVDDRNRTIFYQNFEIKKGA